MTAAPAKGDGFSPVLESFHVVPQSGSQVSNAHLLLLQRCEVLLRAGRPDAMVLAARRVLRLTPESVRLHKLLRQSAVLRREFSYLSNSRQSEAEIPTN